MKKRLLAILMTVILFANSGVLDIYANRQIQVERVMIDDVFYVMGQSVITGEPIIRPTMKLSWKDPDEWEDAADPIDIHSPDFYDVVASNLTRIPNTSNTIRINKGTPEFINKKLDVHERMNLDTGSLYKMEVRPNHYHELQDGSRQLAPSIGTPEYAYAITDLNVKFVTNESSIQVIWDDLGVDDFNYRIVYASGDYTNRGQDLEANKEGEISRTRNSSGVSSFYDPVERRNKLSYTITEGIYPGQVYSLIVEPRVDYYEGRPVMRNRNFPVIRTTSTDVRLDLFEEGEYLRLEWNIPSRVGQGQSQYELVEARLIQYRDGQGSNIVIFDSDAAILGYYKIAKPSRETDYQIRFLYKAVQDQTRSLEPISNIVTYAPSDLMITPTKPVIPKLFSEDIYNELRRDETDDDMRNILRDNYFVPGYTYPGNLNNLLDEYNTYRVLKDYNSINLIWGAFQRRDVDINSPTYGELIFDENINYDIWITESMEAMAYANKVIDDKKYGFSTPNNNITDGSKIYGYNEILSQYYNEEKGTLSPIVPGKLYYIKIVAKKKVANGELRSEPTIVSIYFNYDGAAYEPPTIVKPPLEVKEEESSPTSITLTWEESWWEVVSTSNDDKLTEINEWKHEVWVDGSGKVYGANPKGITTRYFPVYRGENHIDEFLNYLNSLGTDISSISRRMVDLGKDSFGASDVKYKFYRIPYANVRAAIEAKKRTIPNYDFDDYYEELIKGDKDGTNPINWINISPSIDPENLDKLIYREQGLLPNTSYLFILYPYRELFEGQVLHSHYPTPIVVSTEAEEVIVHPDPTVPNLYISNYSDMDITVTWKYNKDFTYELVYSLFEDVSTAIPVEWELPSDILDPKYPVNGEYYEVIVDDLFPNTEYYFWLRAKQPATNKTSHWSNAVLGRTRDVDTPYPPRGFGIASIENMKKHNYDAPVTKDYITVEWILDALDGLQDPNKNVTKNYVYIVEVSDNEGFVDPIYIESSGGSSDKKPNNVEILQKNIVKINNLIANRAYYIRVKTRVIVTGKEEGQLIIKDSLGYSPTIRVFTKTTSDEYDGSRDPDLEILPNEDYEIIYNKDTKELEFRFRDDGVGQDGIKDNNVSQRLISKLISDNTYIYKIDIEDYQGKAISKRIISIPYKVIEAFNSYKIDLEINAGNIIIYMPYGSLSNEINSQIRQYGVAPSVRVEIKPLGINYIKNQIEAVRQITEAQELKLFVNSNKKETQLNYSDKDLEINLLANNKFEEFRVNRIGAVKDSQNNWSQISKTVYNSESGYVNFNTSKIGIYSSYVPENNQVTDKGHWSEASRKQVTNRYAVKGLNNYNPNNRVSEQELVNVIYGIIKGYDEINLGDSISRDIKNALKNSQTKKNDSWTKQQVSREEAISMFVRAYEITYDDIITASSQSISLANNSNISNIYKNDMAKAETMGLISSLNGSRPKDSITYGELFTIWSKLVY